MLAAFFIGGESIKRFLLENTAPRLSEAIMVGSGILPPKTAIYTKRVRGHINSSDFWTS